MQEQKEKRIENLFLSITIFRSKSLNGRSETLNVRSKALNVRSESLNRKSP